MKKHVSSVLIAVLISVFLPGCGRGTGLAVRPEIVDLTIRDGCVHVFNFESAKTPVVRAVTRQGDTLDVDIKTKFQGKGTFAFGIPKGIKKLRIFDCEYELPPPDHTAFFHSLPMVDIRPSWWRFEPEESQRAMMLISFAPDRRRFKAQVRYCGSSGKQTWKREQHFSCIIADDGQIYELPEPETQAQAGTGIRYRSSDTFKNHAGNLRIRLRTTGRFYKLLVEKETSLPRAALPKPEPRP